MGLAAALFFNFLLPVRAAEVPEETVSETWEQTLPPETEPVWTEVPTVPEETVYTEPEETQPALPEESLPQPAETQPITEPTVPGESIPETEVPTEPVLPETTPETVPETVPETLPEPTLETVPDTQPTVPETVPETIPETEPETENLSVAEVLALPAGAQDVRVCASLVYLSGSLGVLQDDTGGIRVSFPENPQTMPGDVLLVTGSRSDGLTVHGFELVGVEELPFVESSLLEAPEALRVHIENAVLGRQSLTQDGFTMSLQGDTGSLLPGDRVDVWGVILDGWFYADRMTVTAAPARAAQPPEKLEPYFGILHAHSSLSNGPTEIEKLFESAKALEGLDFFAVADYSDTFDPEGKGSLSAPDLENAAWIAGKAAAENVTEADRFVGLYGYEMSWPELAHLCTFNTPGWQTCQQPGMETLEGYYQTLLQEPQGFSLFSHPSYYLGYFEGFDPWSAEYDACIPLLEVGSENERIQEYDYFYRMALDKGWHVAPVEGGGYHAAGAAEMGDARTVILAESLTPEALIEAVHSRRVYATQDRDLRISYTVNGAPMGTILPKPLSLHICVKVEDPSGEPISRVELVSDRKPDFVVLSQSGKESILEMETRISHDPQCSYYYLRIFRGDEIVAVTAPVWLDSFEDVFIRNFVSDVEKPAQGEPIQLSMDLFNAEREPFYAESLTVTVNGEMHPVEFPKPEKVEPLKSLHLEFPLLWEKVGKADIAVTLTGVQVNQTRQIHGSLKLMYQSKDTPEDVSIAEARKGIPGVPYRIKGTVTAGNANPYTTFPGTLYLQDETGGIAVKGQVEEKLELGRKMEITGILQEEGGNPVLEMTDYTLLEIAPNPEPTPVSCAQTKQYEVYGGQLLQIQGTVVSLTAKGNAVSRITLRDSQGGQATVLIEDTILSSSHGTNSLASKIKKGRTVKAAGLLHIDEYGKSVLRVRNCDEVRYIPAVVDVSNPRTGDWLAELEAFLRRWLP